MRIINAKSLPPVLVMPMKKPVKIKVIDTLVFDFPIKVLKYVSTWSWGHVSKLKEWKHPNISIHHSILTREIQKHPTFKLIKFLPNQLMTLTFVNIAPDMGVVEVWVDIIEVIRENKCK